MDVEPVFREAILARPGERVKVMNDLYATAGAQYKRYDGEVFRRFLWLTDGKGEPCCITVSHREEWLLVEGRKPTGSTSNRRA